MKRPGERLENSKPDIGSGGKFYEVITSEELAARWRVPPSWIREQTRRRCVDPLPCLRFGRYVRFQWTSPDLEAWLKRRQSRSSHFA